MPTASGFGPYVMPLGVWSRHPCQDLHKEGSHDVMVGHQSICIIICICHVHVHRNSVTVPRLANAVLSGTMHIKKKPDCACLLLRNIQQMECVC